MFDLRGFARQNRSVLQTTPPFSSKGSVAHYLLQFLCRLKMAYRAISLGQFLQKDLAG